MTQPLRAHMDCLVDQCLVGDPSPCAIFTDKPLPTPAPTDGADARTVLRAVQACARTWEPDVRIIGNVRAVDIERAIDEVLA